MKSRTTTVACKFGGACRSLATTALHSVAWSESGFHACSYIMAHVHGVYRAGQQASELVAGGDGWRRDVHRSLGLRQESRKDTGGRQCRGTWRRRPLNEKLRKVQG